MVTLGALQLAALMVIGYMLHRHLWNFRKEFRDHRLHQAANLEAFMKAVAKGSHEHCKGCGLHVQGCVNGVCPNCRKAS